MQITKGRPTVCTFTNSGGPPDIWDIKRYADSIEGFDLPSASRCPATMVPFGLSPAGKGCGLKAHPQCYRLLLGVIGAAHADPGRAAAFAADHPSQRPTRQDTAAGVPEPQVQVARKYGPAPATRATAGATQRTSAVAEEAQAPRGPQLRELRLHGAKIQLINIEALNTPGAAKPLAAEETSEETSEETGDGAAASTWKDAWHAAHAASKSASRARHGGPSKFAPLAKLAQQSSNKQLLAAAQQRGEALTAALAELERQTTQYQEQLELKRSAKTENEALLKENKEMVRLLKAAAKELRSALERLQPFNDAAKMLADAGMSCT